MMLFFSLIFLVADLQAHLWGLDQQLDKFTTDYVQQHLQRASHGLLTIAELDFAFPPNASPAMVIQAKLKEHSSSSGGLHPVSLPFGSTGQQHLHKQGGFSHRGPAPLLVSTCPSVQACCWTGSAVL